MAARLPSGSVTSSGPSLGHHRRDIAFLRLPFCRSTVEQSRLFRWRTVLLRRLGLILSRWLLFVLQLLLLLRMFLLQLLGLLPVLLL